MSALNRRLHGSVAGALSVAEHVISGLTQQAIDVQDGLLLLLDLDVALGHDVLSRGSRRTGGEDTAPDTTVAAESDLDGSAVHGRSAGRRGEDRGAYRWRSGRRTYSQRC